MDLALAPIPVNAPGVLEFNVERDMIWIGMRLAMVAVPLVLLFTGWGARLHDACARLTGGRKILTLALFAAAYLAITSLVILPIGYVYDIGHFAFHDIPTRNVGGWLTGQGMRLVVQSAAAALLLWIPFAIIARAPRFWWLPVSVLLLLGVATAITGEQVVIRPMTTDYQPLPEGALKARVIDLFARCDAEDTPIFIGGDDATLVGLGPTARILLPEDGLTLRSEDQALTTIAHELKHYLLHDNWLAFGAVGGLILTMTLLVHVLGGVAIRLWGDRFGFASLADPKALPLMAFILILSWTVIGAPVMNKTQQWAEWGAERFSLEATRDNDAHASWQAAMANARPQIVDYYWFFEVFRATHPSQADRVAFANTYKPWETGEPLRYAAYCDPPASAP